jgi:hypothetical protein
VTFTNTTSTQFSITEYAYYYSGTNYFITLDPAYQLAAGATYTLSGTPAMTNCKLYYGVSLSKDFTFPSIGTEKTINL